MLQAYLAFIRENQASINLRDLAWTLQHRRSHLDYRFAVSASGVDDLEASLQRISESDGLHQRLRSLNSQTLHPHRKPRILGIFTGQGAQWATMGKDLLEHSSWARTVIARMDDALASLPESDRPDWKIHDELVPDEKKSRINEALLAQTLTTAIQILLVDLIAMAGIQLNTVVGHSSGEMAAAYAAGFLKAKDAIRIAYYRGLHSREAIRRNGEAGGMLAAALSADQAEEFCQQARYAGHLIVAAYNSPCLVTISGDDTSITQALVELEDDGVFARRLQVDRAYHSTHMCPCALPYLQSLQHLQMASLKPDDNASSWYSSVSPGKCVHLTEQVSPEYWIQNLLSPVRFSDAVRTAVTEQAAPDLILEVGPHPTLEKPVRQTLEANVPTTVGYVALLRRGVAASRSVADALGSIWAKFGKGSIDFARVNAMLSSTVHIPQQIQDLPVYPWQHDTEYWWEHRFLRQRYQSTLPPTELLGAKWDIGASHEAKWRSFLNPRETPWLLKHQLNGVAVLPGAAYAVMASTAARFILKDQTILMIEVKDLQFELPIIFSDENASIETVLTVVKIEKSHDHARAEFYVDFCSHQRNDGLMTAARGSLYVRFGFDADRSNPKILSHPSNLTKVECEIFYKTLLDAGYGYFDQFRGVRSIQRRIDFAAGEIMAPCSELIIHPSALDCLLQTSFAAEGYPADSAIPSFRVPARIKSIKLYSTRCEEIFQPARTSSERKSSTAVYASEASDSPSDISVLYDIQRTAAFEYAGSLRSGTGAGVLCQMEGLVTVPFRLSTNEDDLPMFREVAWVPEDPSHLLQNSQFATIRQEEFDHALTCERVAFYYLRQLLESSAPISLSQQQSPEAIRHLIGYAQATVSDAQLGKHSVIQNRWFDDREEDIKKLIAERAESVDLQCIELMGSAYPSIMSGHETTVEVLFRENHLNRFYRDAIGISETNTLLATFVAALTCRSPNLRILEVGAGTGATSEAVLSSTTCAEYVFTDISSAFFETAQEKLRRYSDTVSYQTFDMEQSPLTQGFEAESLDVVIASNVLHASSDVTAVLRNVRSLLRPGGYLVCAELAGGLLKHTAIMGGLQGWWLGLGNDRSWGPALSECQWHEYLEASGFSGLKCITPAADLTARPYRVFCSQATNERMQLLRNPLQHWNGREESSLLIIGEAPAGNPRLISEVVALLSCSFTRVIVAKTLDSLASCDIVPSNVVSLVELTRPMFECITTQDWCALQHLFGQAENVSWITLRATCPTYISDCYSNMTTGLMRTIRNELSHLNISIHDVEDADQVTADYLANAVLRQVITSRGDPAVETKVSQPTEAALMKSITHTPIIRASSKANQRYNSRHRKIQEELETSAHPVEIIYKHSTNHYALRGVSLVPSQVREESTLTVNVRCSSLFSISSRHGGSYFLNIGDAQDGERVLALSKVNCSKLELPQNSVFPVASGQYSDQDLLRHITAQFVAERVVSAACTIGSIVVLTSDPLWMSAIRAKATHCDKKVVFMTSQALFEHDRIVFVHRDSLDLSLKDQIPSDVSLIANVTTRPEDDALFHRLCGLLRHTNVKLRNTETFFQRGLHCSTFDHNLDQDPVMVRDILKKSLNCMATNESASLLEVTCPQDLVGQAAHGPSALVDWTKNNILSVAVSPATEVVVFSAEKTYLIIGSSDVARALCEWMIDRGAKHIILTSRQPDHAQEWARWMMSRGADIRVVSMDVSDETSVRDALASTFNSAETRIPPIAGVIHLALVLRDAAFSNMSYEGLKAVTNVKERGSLILHNVLKDENLDFSIMTSSISYVAGNRGQANYAAGNAFMVGLAKYRRSLGLPASVVHLGRVSGIGYIHNNTKKDHS